MTKQLAGSVASAPTHVSAFVRADQPQTDWYLAWTPHQVLHGHAPWTTDYLSVPHGVNLMWNTLLPLPGLLMGPVTWATNVLATHTLLAVLAFAFSATSEMIFQFWSLAIRASTSGVACPP